MSVNKDQLTKATAEPERVYVPVRPTLRMIHAVLEANRAGAMLIPVAYEYAVAELVWAAMIASYKEHGT
jgi:hypothetical protein